MAADDFLNTPPDQGLPAGLDMPAPSGNRPASGARRATPGEVLSQTFQGAQNAGDFLGLDTEFTAHQDPSQAQAGGPLDLVEPPSTYAPDQAGYVPEPAPLPASDPVQDFAQAPSAFEFGEDLGSEESLLGEAEEKGSSKTGLLVGGLLVAALAVGGVFFGPQLMERFQGGESTPSADVADAGATQSRKTTPPLQTPADASPALAKGAPLGEALVSSSKASSEGSKTSAPSGAGEGSSAKPTPKPSSPAEATLETPGQSNDLASELASVLPTLSGSSPRTTEFPNLEGAAYEWASEDRLELIWRGTEVPMEAVHAPAKTVMPRVGHVRVFTQGGDVFAGRLYAVGQGLVWIDGEPGRIGLDGSKVERIEVLAQDTNETVVTSPDALTGGRRVRVRVPGGMLYGSVLKAEGEEILLALETGGRVRVKVSDVQDLGTGRAVVVRQ